MSRRPKRNIQFFLELLLIKSRWLLAPFFIGLAVAILALLVRFGLKFGKVCSLLLMNGDPGVKSPDIIAPVLALVDTALIATLLLITALRGYELFVSRINTERYPLEDRPIWMQQVDFYNLKIELIGVMVVISALDLLEAFSEIGKFTEFTDKDLAWKIGIHLTFVVSGVLFAITNRIAGEKKPAA